MINVYKYLCGTTRQRKEGAVSRHQVTFSPDETFSRRCRKMSEALQSATRAVPVPATRPFPRFRHGASEHPQEETPNVGRRGRGGPADVTDAHRRRAGAHQKSRESKGAPTLTRRTRCFTTRERRPCRTCGFLPVSRVTDTKNTNPKPINPKPPHDLTGCRLYGFAFWRGQDRWGNWC